MSHFSDFAVWWWWSSGIWRRNTPNFCLIVSTAAAEARRRQLKNSPDLIAFRGNRVRDGAKCQLLSRKISLLNQSLKFQMVLGFFKALKISLGWMWWLILTLLPIAGATLQRLSDINCKRWENKYIPLRWLKVAILKLPLLHATSANCYYGNTRL